MMDIVQKFLHLEDGKRLIFPRYHQLDVVRALIADVRAVGAGHHYLIQHSAGSGKSNSIAWTAYRLASLFDAGNRPIFASVILVTDRRVLDAQLKMVVSGFDHTIGAIETIDEKKSAQDLKRAIEGGARLIVTCHLYRGGPRHLAEPPRACSPTKSFASRHALRSRRSFWRASSLRHSRTSPHKAIRRAKTHGATYSRTRRSSKRSGAH